MQNPRAKWELGAAAIFVAVHLTSPLWIGELYPFTISPMFCDSPAECCRYEILDADERPLDPAPFNLHMVYDGNPPGLGMGIVPRPTLHPFGAIGTEAQVVAHVQEVLRENDENDEGAGSANDSAANLSRVAVRQHHYFSADHQIQHEENVWIVEPAGPAEKAQ